MSWTHHLEDDERDELEEKSARDFAALVRKGLWIGLLTHANQDRKSRGLPPSMIVASE